MAAEVPGIHPDLEPETKSEVPISVEFIPTPEQAATFNTRLEQTIEQNRELEGQLKRQMEVPQIGEYHNEGPTMLSHLQLMSANIDRIADGQFLDELPSEYRQRF